MSEEKNRKSYHLKKHNIELVKAISIYLETSESVVVDYLIDMARDDIKEGTLFDKLTKQHDKKIQRMKKEMKPEDSSLNGRR